MKAAALLMLLVAASLGEHAFCKDPGCVGECIVLSHKKSDHFSQRKKKYVKGYKWLRQCMISLVLPLVLRPSTSHFVHTWLPPCLATVHIAIRSRFYLHQLRGLPNLKL